MYRMCKGYRNYISSLAKDNTQGLTEIQSEELKASQ